MTATFKSEHKLHIGASYYPEHWPQERWPEDIRLMAEAGFTVARMAEFAWSSMEPAPGEFQFDWLENVISQLAAAGLETVVCALALHNNVVPPTINYENPDPECDLDYVPNEAREADVKVVLNNSLGFGGHNACLALRKVE